MLAEIEERNRQRAIASGHPIISREPSGEIVSMAEHNGSRRGKPWGFTLFRTTYDDDELFTAFMTELKRRVLATVNPEYEPGWERVKDNFRFLVVDDKDALDLKFNHEGRSKIIRWVMALSFLSRLSSLPFLCSFPVRSRICPCICVLRGFWIKGLVTE